MLVFEERENRSTRRKTSRSKGENQQQTHIWRRRQDSNPGHIGGRRVLSPLRHPCSSNNISFVLWSPKRSAIMLNPFAQLLQHCWGQARSLRMVYKDSWVVSLPRCTAGPIVGSCCIQQLPTLLAQQCWGLLRPFARCLRDILNQKRNQENKLARKKKRKQQHQHQQQQQQQRQQRQNTIRQLLLFLRQSLSLDS